MMKHHRVRSVDLKNQNMFTVIVVVDYDNFFSHLMRSNI